MACIENESQCAAKFQRIVASIEQVTVVVPGHYGDLSSVLDTLDLGGNEEQKEDPTGKYRPHSMTKVRSTFLETFKQGCYSGKQ